MSYIQHKSEESVEDYLETILILKNQLSEVRSIDIANHMHFSKPSVSVAMKNLRNRNYITVTEEGFIRLTEEGLAIARTVYERHSLLSNWLVKLGVAPDTAAADACKMEHDMSAESFEALKKHILLHYPSCNTET